MLEKKSYPGDGASALQILHLANEYRQAALLLLTTEPSKGLFNAPGRLVSIHAIELYLNAMLLHAGLKPDEARGTQHDLSKRADMAVSKGLKLRRLTLAHLTNLVVGREYLVLRCSPEWKATASQTNRLTATLEELANKVTAIIDPGSRSLRLFTG